MPKQEAPQSDSTRTPINPGSEFIWVWMVNDQNTHTRLYDRGYRTLGCIASKTANELEADGFDSNEVGNLSRLLATRELAFTPVPAVTPPNEPLEAVTAAQAVAAEATAAPSPPQHLQAA